MPTLDLKTEPDPILVKQLTDMREKFGDHVLEVFESRLLAKDYIKAHSLPYEPYGLRRDNQSWWMIRPEERIRYNQHSATQRSAPRSDKPSAKSVCLGIYTPGMGRDEFVEAATAQGVKPVTARTMYSDIKAGRVK